MYSFAKEIRLNEEDIMDIETLPDGTIKQAMRGMASIKNTLLLSEKRVSDPVEIAYRDGAIHFANAMLMKFQNLLESMKKEKDLF